MKIPLSIFVLLLVMGRLARPKIKFRPLSEADPGCEVDWHSHEAGVEQTKDDKWFGLREPPAKADEPLPQDMANKPTGSVMPPNKYNIKDGHPTLRNPYEDSTQVDVDKAALLHLKEFRLADAGLSVSDKKLDINVEANVELDVHHASLRQNLQDKAMFQHQNLPQDSWNTADELSLFSKYPTTKPETGSNDSLDTNGLGPNHEPKTDFSVKEEVNNQLQKDLTITATNNEVKTDASDSKEINSAINQVQKDLPMLTLVKEPKTDASDNNVVNDAINQVPKDIPILSSNREPKTYASENKKVTANLNQQIKNPGLKHCGLKPKKKKRTRKTTQWCLFDDHNDDNKGNAFISNTLNTLSFYFSDYWLQFLFIFCNIFLACIEVSMIYMMISRRNELKIKIQNFKYFISQNLTLLDLDVFRRVMHKINPKSC